MGSGFMGSDSLVVVIDYKMGNVRSVWKAFEYLGSNVIISNSLSDIKKADRLVLPGVGAFGDGIKNLKNIGLDEALGEEVVGKKKPFLGICLGMQLLAKDSEEFGLHQGLGWIDGSVKKLDSGFDKIKIPHVGWNEVEIIDEICPVFSGIKQKSSFYFVHSYHFVCDLKENVKATCKYGKNFTAAIQKENIFATQFHPEKSQMPGLKILENFLAWQGQ